MPRVLFLPLGLLLQGAALCLGVGTVAVTGVGVAGLYLPIESLEALLPAGESPSVARTVADTGRWQRTAVTAALLFGVLPWGPYASRRTWRLGRRFRLASRAPGATGDRRPPVLLLRAFQDDPLPARPLPGFAEGGWGLWNTRTLPRFEEALVERLTSWGPVEALDPSDAAGRARQRVLPPLGARRHGYSDDEWRARIVGHMARASRIVLVLPEAGDNIAYELDIVVRRGWLPRLVIVQPPLVDEEEVSTRWTSTLAILAGLGVAVPVRPDDPAAPQVLVFDETGEAPWVEDLSDAPEPIDRSASEAG